MNEPPIPKPQYMVENCKKDLDGRIGDELCMIQTKGPLHHPLDRKRFEYDDLCKYIYIYYRLPSFSS